MITTEITLFNPTCEDLKRTPIGEWITVIHSSGLTYQNIRGEHCMIALEPLPDYCNCGRFQAKLEVFDSFMLHVDYHDGWEQPRYYFYEESAVMEIEAWLVCRGQMGRRA